MFTRILVPTDFSEPSDAAILYATELASRFGATIHLIHVVESPIVTGAFGVEAYSPESPGVFAALRADAEFKLSERLNGVRRAGVSATCEVLDGPTAPTIVSAAGELAIDLIVMGTHGRVGMAHAIMGSVAERVVRVASCPVLTVHVKPQRQPCAVPAVERANLALA